jgi:hypothetical protein
MTEKNYKLRDPEKFDARFVEMCGTHCTQEEAYLAVEREYKLAWGKNKYSDFDSFYRSWRRRVKRKINQTERL